VNLLVNRHPTKLTSEFGELNYRSHLGLLVTPRMFSGIEQALALGVTWAADNDCFNGLDKPKFIAMLKLVARYPGCKFVSAPDVVGDALGTLTRFRMWQPVIRNHFKLPVALVAQDGLESLLIDWDAFDALFIGGSTAWKLSSHAALLAREAKQRGKWVHMGRVNSNQRIQYGRVIGCDSADGTGYAKFSKAMLTRALPALQTSNLALLPSHEVPCGVFKGTKQQAKKVIDLSAQLTLWGEIAA
jgi:hypothetical protein